MRDAKITLSRPFRRKTALFVALCFCWLVMIPAPVAPTVSGGDMATRAPAKSDEDGPGMIEQTGPVRKPKKSILPWILVGAAAVAIGVVLVLVVFKSKKAAFTIRSVPSPVPYTEDYDGYHYWYFSLEVAETAGVGAELVEWYSDMYDASGNLLGRQNFTLQDFRDWFIDCGGTGVRLEANSTRCCETFWYRSTTNENGWRADQTMVFVDDSDNRITVVGTITFSPIPGLSRSSYQVTTEKPLGQGGKFRK